MRLAPARIASVRSVEIPGADTGLGARVRSKECSRAEGMARVFGSSAAMISEKARPIQSEEASGLRFSKRRMAICSGPGGVLGPHAARKRNGTRRTKERRKLIRLSQNTRIRGQQLLEFVGIAHSREFRILRQLVLFFESLFEGLAQ